MKTSTIATYGLLAAMVLFAGHYTPAPVTEAQDISPPSAEPKKVMLRLPVEDGETILSVAAMVHSDITEITITPVIEKNKVTGARIQSLNQDHTIRASGESLVLDLPSGQVTVGGTFAITSKEGRTMFAVKLEPKAPPVAATPAAEPNDETPKVAATPPPELPNADERIQEILKPKKPKDEE